MLSVTIITLNEERNLRDCLESVRFADEIIVVDSGSRDLTRSIAKEFKAQVFQEPWKGFADQKANLDLKMDRVYKNYKEFCEVFKRRGKKCKKN